MIRPDPCIWYLTRHQGGSKRDYKRFAVWRRTKANSTCRQGFHEGLMDSASRIRYIPRGTLVSMLRDSASLMPRQDPDKSSLVLATHGKFHCIYYHGCLSSFNKPDSLNDVFSAGSNCLNNYVVIPERMRWMSHFRYRCPQMSTRAELAWPQQLSWQPMITNVRMDQHLSK
jgi:hypothetical protein